jgi:phosphoserine phosphatase RsbU/P
MRDYDSPELMKADLGDAARVQRAMLPAALPIVPGYSFWASWEPDLPLGGDLYHLEILPTGEVLAVVADVAGKGIPAALGMAAITGLIPLAFEHSGGDLAKFMSLLNRSICRWSIPAEKFVSMTAILLDPANHRGRVVEAGHGQGLIRRRSGETEKLCSEESCSVPLGLLNEISVKVMPFQMFPCDSVLLVTDGITDPTKTERGAYGMSRLSRIAAQAGGGAAELGEVVLADVKAFRGELPARDDAVVLCFSRHETNVR